MKAKYLVMHVKRIACLRVLLSMLENLERVSHMYTNAGEHKKKLSHTDEYDKSRINGLDFALPMRRPQV